MTTKPSTYPVQLTLAEVIALRDLIVDKHRDQSHYAAQRPDEVEEADSWKLSTIKRAREVQADMSKLHEAVLGAPLEPTPENDPKPADES